MTSSGSCVASMATASSRLRGARYVKGGSRNIGCLYVSPSRAPCGWIGYYLEPLLRTLDFAYGRERKGRNTFRAHPGLLASVSQLKRFENFFGRNGNLIDAHAKGVIYRV